MNRGNPQKAIPADIKRRIHALHRRRSNWRGLLTVAFDWAVIAVAAGAALLSGYHPAVYALAVVVIGSRQRALRSLLHEASHHKLMRNRRANVWVGRLFTSFPLLEGLSSYLCAHCEHHRNLWHEQRDPKRRQYAALGLIRPRDPVRFRRRHLIGPLFLVHVPRNIASALSWSGEDRDETVARFAFLGAAGTVVVAAGWTVPVVLLWLVPYVTVYQVLRYYSDIADHAGLESSDPWRATRSYDASPLVRGLLAPHDDNLHLAHHLFPAVPHYAGAELHRILAEVPHYRNGHHCGGFFRPAGPGRPSVIQDVLHPEHLADYRSGERTNPSSRLRTVLARLTPGALRAWSAPDLPDAPDPCAGCPLTAKGNDATG
ncbi:fatty acid desaturase family protein [Nocardiopsis mangrovi]|uniref:Fatty acid desaturase family protein n=1 Tax=Nocardiopsis mangrovi TaxID=1179818 RepID=A0ABV9DXF1_9ACTN